MKKLGMCLSFVAAMVVLASCSSQTQAPANPQPVQPAHTHHDYKGEM
jgi:hypothetical protein